MIRKKFMIYLNKEDFDYSTGQINPYRFHTTFYMLIKLYRVIDESTPMWTVLVPIITVCTGSVTSVSFGVTMWKHIRNFNLIDLTAAGTYFILMVYKLLLVSCPITQKLYYYRFLRVMKEDFIYICTKGSRYRTKYFELHLKTWKISIMSSIFMASIGGGIAFIATAAMIFFLFYQPEGSVRPLPFPLWAFGFDDTKSPTYEFMFTLSIIATFFHSMTYIFQLQTQIVWIGQVTSKADVIIWSIEDLLLDIKPTSNALEKQYFERLIIGRMAAIVKMHQSMYEMLEDFSAIYRKVLMFEQKLCSPVVCLSAFCAAEKMDMGEIPAFECMLCIAVIILSSIPSYMCTFLADKVEEVCDACWDCPFWNSPGTVIRPYLLLIMQRSMRPLPIQAPGFASVSLETFASNMSVAYSWFNMLRQGTADKK